MFMGKFGTETFAIWTDFIKWALTDDLTDEL